MLEHAQEAVSLLDDRTVEDLVADRVLQLALTRLVEVIGEAASKVSADMRQSNPTIPWREAIATRNMLSHGYDIVRADILHQTICHDLPELIQRLIELLGSD
jgi:uncharacterized protein with HEPN domain